MKVLLTAEILDAVAHRERYLGFHDDFCNQLAGYLIETTGWDRIQAILTVRDMWNHYRKEGQDSLGRLWQFSLYFVDDKLQKEVQAAILHLVNEGNKFTYAYFEAGKPLKEPQKKL